MEGITDIRRYKKAMFFCISIVVMCLVSTAKSTPRNKPCCGPLTNVTNGQWDIFLGSDIAYLVCDIGYCVFPEDAGVSATQCQPNGQWSPPGQEVTCLTTSNLALNYINVSQSTTHHLGGAADLAVDGNRATDWTLGTCTATDEYILDSWWKVTLNGTHPIGRIVMTNRLSANPLVAERLSNLEIYVGIGVADTLCATFSGPGAQDASQYTVTCGNTIMGDTVRIVKNGPARPHNVLTFCEVEIYTFQSRCNGLM